MKQVFATIVTLLLILHATAQPTRDKLAGDWKFYLKDNTSFEFLRLNADGTGLKCFGQTINGKDTFFINHITALLITNWQVKGNNLFIESKNNVSFKVNHEYQFNLLDSDKMELSGEHLIYYLYPSFLNREKFQRTIRYQKADRISKGYGANITACIVEDRHLFTLKPSNSSTTLAEYKGFEDLIPHIIGCQHGYEYTQKYYDPPYSIEIPASINKWSFGFGDKEFYISFSSDDKDKSETSIVIFYDFGDEIKNFFFSEIKKGNWKKDIVKQNNLDIYKIKNLQDKYEGRVFLENSIMIAYYTRDERLLPTLQKCITSFKYK